MIEKIKELRYKFPEQKESYSEICKDLSPKEKYILTENLLKDNLWAYFQLIVELLFDIASKDKNYLELLEKVYIKVKNDLGSTPFFQMLIKLGREKPKIGIFLYNQILKESKNDDFKSTSGLILGGYSINDEVYLTELLEKKEMSFPITNITLKAILVKYENQKQISDKVYKFLDLVSNSNEEIFLRELMNVCIFLYNLNTNYFYDLIKKIMDKKKSRINGMIFIQSKKLGFSNEQFLELAEFTKDCDEYALNELMYAIIDYPEEFEKISELFIYWINKDLEFKINNFDWALGELTKKNKKFIYYFIKNCKKIGTEKLPCFYLFPRIFEKLASQNIEEGVKQLMVNKIYEKDSRLFYELVSKVIGIIYKNSNQEFAFKLFLPLAKKIEEIAKNTDFINDKANTFNKAIKSKNFDELINYTDYLLEQLRFRKTDYDFDEIDKSLSEFVELYRVVKKKIDGLKSKKRYSPLFWLGSQQRDKELKKAYLEEIENFLNFSKEIPNEKNKDNKISLINSLGNEDRFWDNFSEIIFTNKFILRKEDFKTILEPKIPNKKTNADMLTELDRKKIFFEVKNSDRDRSLHLDNGAVWIKNKSDKIIKEKSNQFYSEKTFEEIKKKDRDDLFFIVIDTSSSVIDEYMIANSFLGSLACQFYRNKETGETTEPSWIRNDDAIVKNKNIVSGLIYFKRQLVNLDGKIKFILIGDIIKNDYAVNKPSDEDIKELKEIIFKKN